MKTKFVLVWQLLTPLNQLQGVQSNIKVFTLLLLMLCFNTQWVTAQTVPAAPTNIVATKGDGQITIDFTPGSDGGSTITNYEYKLDNGTWTPFNPASTSSPLLITGLVNCTSYSVQIRAVNSVGSGAESLSAVVTPRARLMAGIEWTTQTSAADNEFYTVTYGNSLFVAVSSFGDGEFVMTSPDGINWTSRVAATNNSWTSVTYGNGLFVAVASFGDGDFVMTSPDGINWTSRAAPDISWLSVTYGNGLFVAVASTGTGDRVMTSPDGINWTSRVSAADNSWNSVTYGNGLFVAVSITGTGNRVMTSPDGINWTSRASAADNSWRSVAYGNGLFVAVSGTGTGNRVMTSPDGINWTSRASAANNNWQEVVYGNGLFVAVAESGTGNRVMTSPDGINWTSRASAANNGWRSVAYGDGKFVAVSSSGIGNRVMTSSVGDFVPAKPEITSITPGTTDLSIAFTAPDDAGGSTISNYEYSIDNGISWITLSPTTTSSPITISGLTASTEYQVQLRAVNSQGSGCPSATMTVTTNAAEVPDAPTNVVATEGVGQIIIDFTPGSDGGSPITNYEYKLNDGSWTSLNPVSTSSPLFITGLENCTSYSIEIRAVNSVGSGAGSETVVVTPRAGIIAGIEWTTQTSAADNEWRSVVYGNGLFVAVANIGTGNRVMTTPDGINWTGRTAATGNEWNSVTYGNGLFVAVASTGTNRVMTSPDGITWTSRTPATGNDWNSVTYGNGKFVAVAATGTGNRVMTSTDGITWTSRTSAADNSWRSVVYGNGLFVAVASTGTGNRVMTSTDGITWTSRTSAADNSWRSVVYGNGLFVAVSSTGTGDRVMTSPDGITWTSRASVADNNWRSVAYGNGLFVSVSSTGTGDRVMTSPDGITWTSRIPASDNDWYAVTYGNGLFVAVSITGTGDRVMTSVSKFVPAKPEITGITPGSTDLSIAFTAPSDDGGSAISNYEYSVDSGATWVTPSPASIVSPISITGLTSGTTYKVQVRAVNTQGSGCASEMVESTTLSSSVPDAPIDLAAIAGDGQVQINFTPGNDGGSAITNYEYSLDSGKTWVALNPANTSSPITIPGLTNGTEYTIILRAVNAVGDGAASEEVAVTPEAAEKEWYIDADGDGFVDGPILAEERPEGGYLASELAGVSLQLGDCNDKDSTLNPTTIWYKDADGDGYSNGDTLIRCLQPTNYKLADSLTSITGDCDDTDSVLNPTTVWYKDADGDGYSNGDTLIRCLQPTNYKLADSLTSITGDCDDADPVLNPATVWYKDADGDGYSNGDTLIRCLKPTNYYLADSLTSITGDCDDADSALNPATVWYKDVDGDGFSNGDTLIRCLQPTNYKLADSLTAISGDCDDADSVLNPATVWYKDTDGDSYSNGDTLMRCTQPANYYLADSLTAVTGDCDDADSVLNPLTVWYKDADGDGYSNGDTLIRCLKPSNYYLADSLTSINGDCDDTNSVLNPATVWYKDEDGDKYSNGDTLIRCLQPTNYYLATSLTDTTGDCNDNDATLNPGVGSDVQIAYTGAYFSSTTNNSATVVLAATIKAPAGIDVRNTKVRFLNRDNGTAITSWLTIGLVNATDLTTGTVTAQYSVTLSSTEDARQITIGFELGGSGSCISRNSSTDNVVINVAKPITDFVTGGGFLIINSSAGIKAADTGTRTNYGFNAKYNKTMKNIQGNLNAIVRRMESGTLRVYQVKANSMTSLSAVAATATAPAQATLSGKASIQDITNPLSPQSVDGNATLLVNMTDMGEPGTYDMIGITVWNKEGGLWYASNWDGLKTLQQQIARGNIQVLQPQSNTGTAATTISVNSSKSPSNVGDSVSFTATVNESNLKFNPTGYVVFYDNSALMGYAQIATGSKAVLKTSALSVGTHTIKAYYRGDTRFKSSEGTFTQTVNALSLTVANKIPVAGSPATLKNNSADRLQLNVMGNPSSDLFRVHVQGNSKDPMALLVTDVLGRVQEMRTGLSNGQTIYVGADWVHGIYFATLVQNKQRIVVKLVKAK